MEKKLQDLAREYAEEIRKDILPFFPRPLPDSMEVLVKADEEYYARFFEWLLRRYCLVEKRKVKDEYDEARIFCENVDPCGESYARNEARMFLLERLFPEIAKEVEG